MTDLLIKIVYNIFGKNTILSSDDLIERVHEVLKPINELHNISYYPAVQHILNSILVSIKLKRSFIELINPQIDYSDHEDFVSVQLLIESYVLKYTKTSFMEYAKKIMKFISQNADKKNGDHVKYSSFAYAQMKQPRPDTRGDYSKMDYIPKFWDCKLITDALNKLALNKGHLSLVTSLSREDKNHFMKRAIGDVGSYAEQKYHKDKISKLEYFKIKEIIGNLKKISSDKKISIEKKFDIFNNIQHEININHELSLVCSYIAKIPDDTDYKLFYENYLQKKINKDDIRRAITSCKNELFPTQGQYVNAVQWNKLVSFIINNFPEKLTDVMRANYEFIKTLAE